MKGKKTINWYKFLNSNLANIDNLVLSRQALISIIKKAGFVSKETNLEQKFFRSDNRHPLYSAEFLQLTRPVYRANYNNGNEQNKVLTVPLYKWWSSNKDNSDSNGYNSENNRDKSKKANQRTFLDKSIASLLTMTASLSIANNAQADSAHSTNLEFEEILEHIKSNDPKYTYINLSLMDVDQEKLKKLHSYITKNTQVGRITWKSGKNFDATYKKLKNEIEDKIRENNQQYQYYPSDYILALLSKHAYEKSSDLNKHLVSKQSLVFKNERNTDHIFALLIKHDHEEYFDYDELQNLAFRKGENAISNSWSHDLDGWRILSVSPSSNSGYTGVIYINDNSKQIVLSHKGTNPLDLKDVATDFFSVFMNIISSQQGEAYILTQKAVDETKNKEYHLTITGHSLGGWLAALSCYYCYKNFKHQLEDQEVKIVTFDSPGTVSMFKSYEPNIKNHETTLDFRDLNMVTYLTVPNMINNCDGHYGKVYTIFPKKALTKNEWRLGNNHALSEIIQVFDPDTGKPKDYKKLEDWPSLDYFTAPFIKSVVLGALKFNPVWGIPISGLEKYFKGTIFSHLDNTEFYDIYRNHIKVSNKAINEEEEKLNNREYSLGWYMLQFQKERSNIIFLNDKSFAHQIKELQEYYEITNEGNIKLTQNAINKNISLEKIFSRAKRLLAIIKSDTSLKSDIDDLVNGRKEKLTSDEISMLLPKEKYVDRDAKLNDIQNGLNANKVVVITGDSGTGKSTLAAEYGFNGLKQEYIIKWFNEKTLPIAYTYLAKELEIKVEDNASQDYIRKKVNEALKEKDKVIFIFDNVNEFTDEIIKYISELPLNIKLIITTNNKNQNNFKRSPYPVEVSSFTEKEAERYFKSNLFGIKECDIQKLIKMLGFLPYNLNMAINIFNKDETLSVKKFVNLCEKHNIDNLQEKQNSPTNLILKLFFESEIGDKNGFRILQYCSFLNPDFVSLDLIKEIIIKKDDYSFIKKLLGFKNNIDQDIKDIIFRSKPLSIEIVSHSDEKGIRIHRLLQSAIREYLQESKSTDLQTEDKLIIELSEIIALRFFSRDNRDVIKLEQNDLYKPHVEKILKYAKEKELNLSPALAYLQVALGTYYDFRGNNQEAVDILQDLESVFKKSLGTDELSPKKICEVLASIDTKLPTIYAQTLYHLARSYFSIANNLKETKLEIDQEKYVKYNQDAKTLFEAAVFIRDIIDSNEVFDDSFNQGEPRPVDSTILKRNGILLWHEFQKTPDDFKAAIKGYRELITVEKAYSSKDDFNLDTCYRQLVRCSIAIAKMDSGDTSNGEKKEILYNAIKETSKHFGIENIEDINGKEVSIKKLLERLDVQFKSDPKVGKYYNLFGEIFYSLYFLSNAREDLKYSKLFFRRALEIESNNMENNPSYKENFIFKDAKRFLLQIEDEERKSEMDKGDDNEKGGSSPPIIATSAAVGNVKSIEKNINPSSLQAETAKKSHDITNDRVYQVRHMVAVYNNPVLNHPQRQELIQFAYNKGGMELVNTLINLGLSTQKDQQFWNSVDLVSLTNILESSLLLSNKQNEQASLPKPELTDLTFIEYRQESILTQNQEDISQSEFFESTQFLAIPNKAEKNYDNSAGIAADSFKPIYMDNLVIGSFIVKEIIETAPVIKYCFKEILHIQYLLPQIIQHEELIAFPAFVNNHYFWISLHYATCNIGMIAVLGRDEVTLTKAIVPMLATATYGGKLLFYDYFIKQKEQVFSNTQDKSIDNPLEFIKKCGFDIVSQTVFGLASGGIVKMMSSNMPLTMVTYDIVISATVGGAQCYNTYNSEFHQHSTYSVVGTISPYVIDIIALYVITNNLNVDFTTQVGKMMAIKQSLVVMSAIVTTDYMAKSVISVIEDGFRELPVTQTINYIKEWCSDMLGDTYNYFTLNE